MPRRKSIKLTHSDLVHDIVLSWLKRNNVPEDQRESIRIALSQASASTSASATDTKNNAHTTNTTSDVEAELYLTQVAKLAHDLGLHPHLTTSASSLFDHVAESDYHLWLHQRSTLSATAAPKRKLFEMQVEEMKVKVEDASAREAIQKEIGEFIQSKRSRIDISNRQEFLGGSESAGSARTSTPNPDLNRRIQMKVEAIENDYGPLQRTNQTPSQVQSHPTPATNADDLLQQRLVLLESHLNVPDTSKSAWHRLQALEQRVLDIERQQKEVQETLGREKTKAVRFLVDTQGNGGGGSDRTDVKVLRAANQVQRRREDDLESIQKQTEVLDGRIRELKAKLSGDAESDRIGQ